MDFVVQKLDHEDEEGGLEQACSQASLHQQPQNDDACDIMMIFPKRLDIVIMLLMMMMHVLISTPKL